jgi:putative ABC transport system substrate-binding protein
MKENSIRRLVLVVLFLFLNCSPFFFLHAEQKEFVVVLAVLKDNPDYHAARSGFVSVLEEDENIKVKFKLLDAFGDLQYYEDSINKLSQEADLIFTTGTRSTLPVAKSIKDVPVVFAAVTAPVRSGIVSDLQHPGGNVTGTHCAVPAYAQLKTIQKVIPWVKKNRVGLY